MSVLVPTDSRGVAFPVYEAVARTATPTAEAFANPHGCKHLVVVIDVTAATGSPSVVFTIQGYDPVSGKTWTILASAAKTGTGTTVLRVTPTIAISANLIALDIVPAFLKIAPVHTGVDSITYSVSAHLAG